MSLLALVLIGVALLVAWKVTKLFVRIAMVGVVLFALYLLLGPIAGAG